MGKKQDQELVDRIAKEIIQSRTMEMIFNRRTKSMFLYINFGGKTGEYRSKNIVTANDLWNDFRMHEMIVQKIDDLRSASLGRIVGSENGVIGHDGRRRTSAREAAGVGEYPAPIANSPSPQGTLESLASVVLAAAVYDLLCAKLVPIESYAPGFFDRFR